MCPCRSDRCLEGGPARRRCGAHGEATRRWRLATNSGLCYHTRCNRAPVAQLDRVTDYESGGRRFESCRARQVPASSWFLRRLLTRRVLDNTAVHFAVRP